MLQLATRLPRERFAVEFLTVVGSGPLDDQATSNGIRVRSIGAAPLHGSSRLVQAVGRAGKIKDYATTVRRQHYDIVDAWIYPLDVLAAIMRPIAGNAVVIAGRRNIDPHRSFGPLSRTVDGITARLVDAVVANSQAAADNAVVAQGVPAGKVRIIRNGVEPIDALAETERNAVRREFGASDRDFVIGCVGHFRADKCHDMLLRVFGALLGRHPALRLVLVGDGDTRIRIEQEIHALGLAEQVTLLGQTLDVRRLYNAFDVVVQASRREGLPNVLLEAASAGRPIVATAAGGSVEIILDGETGLLVPTDNASALFVALERAIEEPQLRARLGAGAQRHVARSFGMDRFIREFGDMYEELATRKSALRRASIAS
jgi:glycosyltransferase involved in cell wall biosynthesis